jgi:uncharacterized protein YaiE (UPF0345 family)
MYNNEFKNVTVTKKANIYFDGKVSSRNILFVDGTRKTLGIMLPGEYEFGTGDRETMEIFEGEVSVLLPDSKKWCNFASGEIFNVPANSKFLIKLTKPVDYCCSYG